jgi:hypothetical protein
MASVFELTPATISVTDEYMIAKIQAVHRGKIARKSLADRKDISVESKERITHAQKKCHEQRDFYNEIHELIGVDKTTYNSRPALQEAHAYLEKHEISRIMECLMAKILLERPDDLRGFIVAELKEQIKRRAAKEASMGPFNGNEDIEYMFDMWDHHGLGVIPVDKVYDTLFSLQRGSTAKKAVAKFCPEGKTEVNKETFVSIVKSELETHFAP